VSYSHQNNDIVFPVLNELHDRGLRVWYDRGITPGSEWPEEIAKHLIGCGLFLLFMSPEAAESQNVRSEITMALDKQKPLMNVFLRDMELQPGLQLQLNLIQYLAYPSHGGEGFDKFMNSLTSILLKKEPRLIGTLDTRPAATTVPLDAPDDEGRDAHPHPHPVTHGHGAHTTPKDVSCAAASPEATGPRLTLVGTAGHPAQILVSVDVGVSFTIGRHDKSRGVKQSSFEFPPDTKEVSRRHAAIDRRTDGYFITDLSSSAGTYCNGRRLAPSTPVRLEPGTRVSFGRAGADYTWGG
jgi:pSer/pThr/pTyr-binding forkhead associated (FHA) protein